MPQNLFTLEKPYVHHYVVQGIRAAAISFAMCVALFLLLMTFKLGIIL